MAFPAPQHPQMFLFYQRVWFFFLICFLFSWLWIVNETNSCVRESERERVREAKDWVWKGVDVYLSKCGWPQMISNKRSVPAHHTSSYLRMLIFHLCIAGLNCFPLALRLPQLLMSQSFCMLWICFVITSTSRCDVGALKVGGNGSCKLTGTLQVCVRNLFHIHRG